MVTQELLNAAATDPDSPAWTAIRRAQADASLLPWLARTAAGFDPRARDGVVVLAGILAVEATDEERATHSSEIAQLKSFAAELLPTMTDDEDYVILRQAMLALDGDEIWGTWLDALNAGEIDVPCPECDEPLLYALTDDTIEPGLSSPLATQLHTEAVQAGRPALAAALTQMFGHVTCPECATRFGLGDQVT
ncbi:hypothetical protein FB565_008745 [Actinoplanes lutulentus]|uniref:Uncharacterized protein n=1 Tax=Actinoplanes lutulentus TaxID=1287878 RepID=A0A327YZ27_9ACTN|nr:hypothetical protein [Actinoplanes lutulentus]MBB2948959.1 hypothetical protein [Actinoplanes lutulentus]RAK26258.1 hypothetical protein B0I29_128108 [Actinoplanes lutulentus]